MPPEDMNAMGVLNERWGVCGFTSCLYSLYENSPALRSDLTHSAQQRTRLVAEIKSFLKQLEADGNALALQEIENFTGSFDGFKGFTIDEYIRKINAVAARGQSIVVGDFSIAMPPDAVVAYLRYIGLRNARIVAASDASAKSELVLGLRDPDGKLQMHGGLAHYVYQKGTTIYSWGKQFPDIGAAGFSDVCVYISPNG